MPIATGHEREELEAALQVYFSFLFLNINIYEIAISITNFIYLFIQGRNVLEINYPVGPFGTKVTLFLSSHFYEAYYKIVVKIVFHIFL